MKAFDYDAVVLGNEVYCLSCLPENTKSKDYSPIFASSEWSEYPICSECGEVHDYVQLIIRKDQKYCIMKTSCHQENPSPYAGPTCEAAGITPKYYSDREKAAKDAKDLSEYNPVGFTVVKAKKLHPDFPVE